MERIIIYLIVGFFAQMIDGTLGMAYGVSATTFLVATGVTPAAASAGVHLAELATTGVSGLSHLRFGNIDNVLMRRIVLPGVLGAILGAYVLTTLPTEPIRLFVAIYLLGMGGVILYRSLKVPPAQIVRSYLEPLGFVGGFMDALGGGGWGPIVASTLLARGNSYRFTVGSVNAAEFFVAAAASVTFIITTRSVPWMAVLGLAIGGVVAAPIAAYVCQRAPTRPLMFIVGLLIIALNLRTLYQLLG